MESDAPDAKSPGKIKKRHGDAIKREEEEVKSELVENIENRSINLSFTPTGSRKKLKKEKHHSWYAYAPFLLR